jgi:hypothetical protein
MWRKNREDGQSVVEVGLILAVFFLLTAGLIDVGRAIFLYNQLSAVGRFGSRWGSVVGGACALPWAASSSDWCNQIGNQTSGFWAQNGNKPLEGYGSECPNYSSTSSDWYTASDYATSTTTTIVGAVAQKFDTDNAHTNLFKALFAPGVDLSNLKVCIETTNTTVVPSPGNSITVNVYYPFTPAGGLFGNGATFGMSSECQYYIE